jgi:hypothetical protein
MRFLILLISCLLISCESTSDPETPHNSTVLQVGKARANTYYTEIKDADSLPTSVRTAAQQYAQQGEQEYLDVPLFTIQLRPTAKVRALLASGKETFVLSVVLLGRAANPSEVADKAYYDAHEEGIYLLDKEYPMKQFPKEITIQERIPKAAYEALKDKNYDVVIDGFSGRKSSDINLFHTDVLTGKITDFKGTQQVLGVRLLE